MPTPDRLPHTLTLDGIETAYFDAGSGPPIVMLHGMAATSDIWHSTIDALSAEYHTIAPDLPGHGRSSGRAWPYSLRFYVRWLDGLRNALSLESITLFGNSMGGAISLAYALTHPHRVKRLVLVDALGVSGRFPFDTSGRLLARLPAAAALAWTGQIDPYAFRFLRGMVFVDPTSTPRDTIQTMVDLNQRQGFWSFWAGARLLVADFLLPGQRRDFARKLSSIAAPTLIVWGRHDGLLPIRNAYAGIENMPGAQLKIFENSAHSPMLEEPETFNRVVLEFLKQIEDK